MKNIIVMLIFLLTYFSNLYSQNSVSFIVVDSVSQKAIPFVKIIVDCKNRGTYSDENGLVKLNKLFTDDKLIIGCIGYQSRLMAIEELMRQEQIQLSPKTYDLDEVIIKSNEYKEFEIGYSKIRSYSSFGNTIIGSELATLIEPMDLGNAYIKEIIFKIKKNAKNNPIVRIHLYKNQRGKPGEEIYLKNNILIINKDNKITFRITNQVVMLPKEGIFVSMEWIGKYYDHGEVYIDTSKKLNPNVKIKISKNLKKVISYSRLWSVWSPIKIGKKHYIPLFGLKIEGGG